MLCEQPSMRCACCGSTDIVVITTWPDTTFATGWGVPTNRLSLDEITRALTLPLLPDPASLFGWYNIFRPAEPAQRPRAEWIAYGHRRPQARACRLDRGRWKRRRFVQSLRRRS
jgi:hypothetical protein